MNKEERRFLYKNYYMDFDTFIEYLIEKCIKNKPFLEGVE